MFQALAHEVRREILEQLSAGEASVGELAEPFAMSLAAGGEEHLPEHSARIALELAPGIVNEDRRATVGFDPQIPVAGDASPTSALIAFLGACQPCRQPAGPN